ncbi:alpha-E domain-containing protein [Rhizobiaceae bacterium]|nr:alpha-E domain-containing protein [Rhizobiaceae bacterium]
MLGRTANGVFWMFRYLERSENTARLVEAGLRLALTRPDSSSDEWRSVIRTAGLIKDFDSRHDDYDASSAVRFLLADPSNPSSVISSLHAARTNARAVRTALTREVWEATNECWLTLKDALDGSLPDRELPELLSLIRKQSALVRGALYGTMLRNDIYDFARLGTYIERSDNTARILDVKYYVLLPSKALVGSSADNVQWETILRSVSGQRAYRWLHGNEVSARSIAEFVILDRRMPRSLAFSASSLVEALEYLNTEYETHTSSLDLAHQQLAMLEEGSIGSVFRSGLHEYIAKFIKHNDALAAQISQDYRFLS